MWDQRREYHQIKSFCVLSYMVAAISVGLAFLIKCMQV